MINKLTFRNFKGLRQVDLSLERLTVLVGPNASGKTSILEGLNYLSQLCSRKPEDVFGGGRKLASLYSRDGIGPLEITATGDSGGIRFEAHSEAQLTLFKELEDSDESFQRLSKTWASSVEIKDENAISSAWSPMDRVTELMRTFRFGVFLRLDATRLGEPSHLEELSVKQALKPDRYSKPRLKFDGSGLASVLADMALENPEGFEALQRSLQSIIPTVNRVRIRRVPMVRNEPEIVTINDNKIMTRSRRSLWAESIVFDVKGASDIPASAASEGTLFVLGLLAVLMGPSRPKFIFLDDLDRGLHPKAQKDLIALLRLFLYQNMDTQIVATTHSPYLLDSLSAQEVRLTNLKNDGSTVCAKLSDSPDYNKWKDDMTPGELWSTLGESWVKDIETVESP